MLKLSKVCLKTYNLQNTAINVIIIKRLFHLRSSHTEGSLRLTTPRIQSTLHRKHIQGSVTQQLCRLSNLEYCANNTHHAEASQRKFENSQNSYSYEH